MDLDFDLSPNIVQVQEIYIHVLVSYHLIIEYITDTRYFFREQY